MCVHMYVIACMYARAYVFYYIIKPFIQSYHLDLQLRDSINFYDQAVFHYIYTYIV